MDFLPTMAQGASQSIEGALNYLIYLKKTIKMHKYLF